MITRLRLRNYKGFDDFTLHLRATSFLVGPNNAGKSTIIAALRLCATVLAHGKRRKPGIARFDETRDRHIRAFSLTMPLGSFVHENVRHEMRDHLEARIELHFKNKAALYVVWPVDEQPFCYLEHVPGAQPINPKVVRDWYTSIGVVQTLSPIEHRETLLSESHVRENLATQLASRHFRNQLFYYQRDSAQDFQDLCDFIIDNTPEIDRIELLSAALAEGNLNLHLMFRETISRSEKELCWAGDGLQVWIQLLFHIWRQSDLSALILDEPDVFLHPDLQRRLVHILEALRCQVVLATHAPELLAEANRETVVMVDRHKKRSRRVSDEAVLADLNSVLGSGFNLRLVKALRSRVALFVEGQDMRILKNFARTLGADFVAQDRGLTVVPMGGASNRKLASSFGWINSKLLDGAVEIRLLLDRDYMTDEAVATLEREFEEAGVLAHVWERKELESYLLSTSAISRLAKVEEQIFDEMLARVVDGLKSKVRSRYLAARTDNERGAGQHVISIYDRCLPEFEARWDADAAWRVNVAPAKDVLSGLNRAIQEVGGQAVSSAGLSSRMRSHEITREMRDYILELNDRLA